MRGSAASCRIFVGLTDDLGQAPVEHDHLAVAAEHHVFGLEIAVDHPPRVRIADRLTDLDERLEQLPLQLEPVRRLARAAAMELGNGVAQGLTPHETHGVKRLVVFLAASQLVDRDDVGVLELAGDLRFLEESPPGFGAQARRGLDFLEGHVAVQVGVVCNPDLAEPPLGVQAGERVPQRIALRRRRHERFDQDVPPGRRAGPERTEAAGGY